MSPPIDPSRPAWSLRDAAWVAATVVVVLLFIGVAERIAFRGRVMPGVHVASLNVGSERETVAYASITKLATGLERRPILAIASGHGLSADPSAVRLRVDTRATLRRAREAGRSGNPIEQVLGTLLRRIRPDHVDPIVAFDTSDVEATVDRWSDEVDRGVREGGLRFRGTTVIEVPPHSGTGINRDEAIVGLVRELRDGSRTTLHLSYGPISARTTSAQVAAVARRARTILGHGLQITSSGHTFIATPTQIATALWTQVVGDRIVLRASATRLAAALRPQLDAIGTAPVDARFEVTSTNQVAVVPSQDGLEPDLSRVARAILGNSTAVTVPLARRHPAHDTKWAQRLGITQEVSSFTTYYVPGQARVTNIHRAADILNGTVVAPGQVFSLNDTLGPRTPQRGFVKAPVYYQEETEDYGGGVSQIATTTYNAVFWGGYEIVAHQPHTIYYSRYPLGRDATVNYPVLDFKWRNNSHHGVLIRAYYNASSITVTFYGDLEGKVVKEESTNCSSTSPTRRCVDILTTTPFPTTVVPCPPKDPHIDPSNECALLAPGQQLDLAGGHTGYAVQFFRVIDQPGHPEIRERHTWTYTMLPDYILVGATPKGATTTVAHGPTTEPSTSSTTIP